MLRPSFPELMHGLFWFAMAMTIIGVGIKGCTVLDGIEKRQLQGNLHHEKIMAMADKSLADHEKFLAQHEAMMQRLAR